MRRPIEIARRSAATYEDPELASEGDDDDAPDDLPPLPDHPTIPKTEMFSGLLNRLEADVQERIWLRKIVEDRWLLDLAQYEGRDDSAETRARQQENKSTVVVNATQGKCDTAEAKTFDLLFPTDDRNWGMSPRPMPELEAEAQELDAEKERFAAEANAPDIADEEASEAAIAADALMQRIGEIEGARADQRRRADLMVDEIEDNLTGCHYPQECRDVIHDGITFGTGILKGPIPHSERITKNWIRDKDLGWKIQWSQDRKDRFSFQHVSFWNFFPTVGIQDFRQLTDSYERHIMSERGLVELARQPGVDQDAVRRLLEHGPTDSVPYYLTEMDAITAEGSRSGQKRAWIVWEYRGPIETEEMREVMTVLLGPDRMKEVEIDPLFRLDALILFCAGEILKVGISHMDDNAPVYSFFQPRRSPARLWSVGVAYMLRHPQAVLNDAWRGMLDNSGFVAFPIIEIDLNVIQRRDNANTIEPGTIFERQPGAASGQQGVFVHQVTPSQEAFAGIISMVQAFIDQETTISQIASGEQGATTRTAGGMALLMNSVNVIFRRIVKMFDDQITLTVINRSNDFLMQFSEKEEIKGDFQVKARGSDVLLVREVQAQNLLLLATQVAMIPQLGKMLRMRDLMKKLLQSMMIPADDVLLTLPELRQLEQAEREAAENAPPSPEEMKLQMQMEIAQMTNETRLAIEQLKQEGAFAKLSAQQQMSMEGALARFEQLRLQVGSKERIFAAEAGIETKRADVEGRGSGGYF